MSGEANRFYVARRERNCAARIIMGSGEVIGAVVNFAQHGEQLGIVWGEFEGAFEPERGSFETGEGEEFLCGEMAGADGLNVAESLFVRLQSFVEFVNSPVTFGELVPELGIVLLEGGCFFEMANGRGEIAIVKSGEGS